MHAIVTFLALLELLNQQDLDIVQGEGLNQFWLSAKAETEETPDLPEEEPEQVEEVAEEAGEEE